MANTNVDASVSESADQLPAEMESKQETIEGSRSLNVSTASILSTHLADVEGAVGKYCI